MPGLLSWLQRMVGAPGAGPSFPRRGVVDFEALMPAEHDSSFDLGIYEALCREGGNVCVSPCSVRAVLALAAAGARAQTADEINLLLHLGPGPESVGPARQYPGAASPGSPGLTIANAAWVHRQGEILASFLEAARTRGTEVFAVDFANDRTVRSKINAWVHEETQHRIRDLLAPGDLDASTRLVLLNAIHFKGRWEESFQPALTKTQPFYLVTGGSVAVPMMHRKDVCWYSRGDGWHAVDLCYQEANLALFLLVPFKHDGLAAIERQLTARSIEDAAHAMSPCEVALFVPKFDIGERVELSGALKALGVSLAFDPARADFSGINGRRPPDPDALCLSRVIHQGAIQVDEVGTTASAATAGTITLGAPLRPPATPLVRADHPFLYAIRERRTGMLLFLGRVMNPSG